MIYPDLKTIIFLLSSLCVFCESKMCDDNWRQYNKLKQSRKRTPIIKIHSGKIRGQVLRNVWSGAEYSSFKGIRYGEPPVNAKRFSPPNDVNHWEGVLNTVEHGNRCPQIRYGDFKGNENCLFLNVYTPVVDFDNVKSKKPNKTVMVWIHGGAFSTGSGDSQRYGPDFLIDKDVILVTLNYRLSALGFLNLAVKKVPGNAGLKDQTLALKWVKRNIALFGGDPENVTIFGQSAGAACVDWHLATEMSQGLFKRSIALSGSALCKWAFTNKTLIYGHKLEKKLNSQKHENYNTLKVSESKHQNLVRDTEVVLQADIHKLIKGADSISDLRKKEIAFVPSIEKLPSKNKFIDDYFGNKLKDGKFHQGDHLMGYTNAEIKFLYGKMRNTILRKLMGEERSLLLLKNMKKNKCIQLKINAPFVKQLSLKFFNKPIDFKQQCMLQYGHGNNSVYYYLFSYEGRNKTFFNGVGHSKDLKYLFYSKNTGQSCERYTPTQNPEDFNPDIIMRDRFVTMITNFAKCGDPSVHSSQDIFFSNIYWQKSNAGGNYLEISKNGTFAMMPGRPSGSMIENLEI